MKSTLVRRLAIALAVVPLLFAAACGSDDDPGVTKADDAVDGGKVVIVGQKFTEADIMAELYKALLDNAGFEASIQGLGARDLYLDPLIQGSVQVSTDYLSSMTEALNRKANGDDAAKVASPDTDATLAELNKLATKDGLTALKPAEAQDANAFAVTKEFAEANDLTTLSDLGELGKDIKLGAAEDCPQRPDCKLGLVGTYGIKITKVVPTGFGTAETKKDLVDGATQLGLVGSTDATLEKDGLVILEDDKALQNAENLVPIVNSAWLADHPQAQVALDALSSVLTTADLTELIGAVDIGREKAADVAVAYLTDKGLLK